MAFFEWDTALETGHAAIDEQHRELFALANALHEVVLTPDEEREAVESAVYQLTDYVVQHFADEEELMQGVGYPASGVHASLHAHLTGEVLRLATRFMNGEDVASAEIAPLLTGWLRTHILQEDERMVAFVREAEAR